MNKTVLWVLIGVIVLGGILYLATGKKSSAPATTSNTNVESSANTSANATPAANSSAAPQSLKDLLAFGGSQKCTFSDSGSSGTFYVSGGKARGDFSSTVAGKTEMTHMIMDGQISYVWVDGQKQGFKMSASDMASAQSSAPAAAPKAVDANKKMDYSCSPWAADSTMFALPAGVQFMDMSAMMKVPVPTK